MSEGCDRAASLELPPRLSGGVGGYRAFELVWADGSRPAMLVLRLKTGAGFALGYAWLTRADYDPAGVVTLTFAGVAAVVLTGRNLRPVFEAAAAHQAVWVAEADRSAGMSADDDLTVIESIACAEPADER